MKDDVISRRAAIDVLEERRRANGYSNVALVSELNRSIGYLMRLPSAQPVDAIPMKWIMKYYEDHPAGFVTGMIYDWAIEQAEREEKCD